MTSSAYGECRAFMRWCLYGGPCCGRLNGPQRPEDEQMQGDAYRWTPEAPQSPQDRP